MIVTTQNPIIYSNAIGDGSLRGKVQGFIDKQKGEGGILDKAKGLVGGYLKNAQQQGQTQTAPTLPPTPTKPKGMSKNLKIGLIVGGSLLVVGIIAVIIIKAKNK
jgi:hypothetical protein